MNQKMLNPNSLETEIINIVDRRGRKIAETNIDTARKLVGNGYYAVTTSDISFV
jgi:hypothetical protein